ncbi:DUF2510 domain-containing protein [Nocardioides sp.]|uniref:DUF2510 domain-containing protein n=1 Tax=Nocardioides sp. TaxID=35761 RepID=UPI001A2762E2|nr:DUF2510 domain-containing protein [Nocardioides sp.]MBJ7358975.1 DUF2510 domain-containing protein [Nocardioides sp.]
MTEAPPAAWFPDPDDPAQYRYWDGTAWTEHRAPRSTTSDQLSKAGKDLADGLAKGLTAVGGWLDKNVAQIGKPSFASVAASCQDEPPREPLSHSVELVHAPGDLPGLLPIFASSSVALTPEGGTLEQPCRFVPNPWDPRDPTGVAVFVGTTNIGRFPADDAATYCPPLAALASRSVLATGIVTIWASGAGQVQAARATARVGDVAAYA